MGPQPKAVSDDVSKRMLMVIIAMLAIILIPVTVASVPSSKLVITITNADTDLVTGYLSVYGADHRSVEILLMPGDERVLSYSLKAGTYQVYIYYSFQNDSGYYGRPYSTTVSVSMFETEEVHVELARVHLTESLTA